VLVTDLAVRRSALLRPEAPSCAVDMARIGTNETDSQMSPCAAAVHS
jgi:hypothetical protein